MRSQICAFICVALSISAARADDSDATAISQLARQFWADLNLGDLEKIPALGRAADAGIVPAPRAAQAVGMMKMKDSPGAAGLRNEISAQLPKVFTFSAPVIQSDGKSAEVSIELVPAEAKPMFQLKAVYSAYLRAAYMAQQGGQPAPDLASLRAEVLAPGSPQEKAIDDKVTGFEAGALPSLTFEKTSEGWKMNLAKFFGKKS